MVGNLLSVTDAVNNQTNYTYDSRNRALTRKDALLKTDTYVYDGNSDITQHTDRRCKVTNYTYDALNRRTFVGFGATTQGHTTNTRARSLIHGTPATASPRRWIRSREPSIGLGTA